MNESEIIENLLNCLADLGDRLEEAVDEIPDRYTVKIRAAMAIAKKEVDYATRHLAK